MKIHIPRIILLIFMFCYSYNFNLNSNAFRKLETNISNSGIEKRCLVYYVTAMSFNLYSICLDFKIIIEHRPHKSNQTYGFSKTTSISFELRSFYLSKLTKNSDTDNEYENKMHLLDYNNKRGNHSFLTKFKFIYLGNLIKNIIKVNSNFNHWVGNNVWRVTLCIEEESICEEGENNLFVLYIAAIFIFDENLLPKYIIDADLFEYGYPHDSEFYGYKDDELYDSMVEMEGINAKEGSFQYPKEEDAQKILDELKKEGAKEKLIQRVKDNMENMKNRKGMKEKDNETKITNNEFLNASNLNHKKRNNLSWKSKIIIVCILLLFFLIILFSFYKMYCFNMNTKL